MGGAKGESDGVGRLTEDDGVIDDDTVQLRPSTGPSTAPSVAPATTAPTTSDGASLLMPPSTTDDATGLVTGSGQASNWGTDDAGDGRDASLVEGEGKTDSWGDENESSADGEMSAEQSAKDKAGNHWGQTKSWQSSDSQTEAFKDKHSGSVDDETDEITEGTDAAEDTPSAATETEMGDDDAAWAEGSETTEDSNKWGVWGKDGQDTTAVSERNANGSLDGGVGRLTEDDGVIDDDAVQLRPSTGPSTAPSAAPATTAPSAAVDSVSSGAVEGEAEDVEEAVATIDDDEETLTNNDKTRWNVWGDKMDSAEDDDAAAAADSETTVDTRKWGVWGDKDPSVDTSSTSVTPAAELLPSSTGGHGAEMGMNEDSTFTATIDSADFLQFDAVDAFFNYKGVSFNSLDTASQNNYLPTSMTISLDTELVKGNVGSQALDGYVTFSMSHNIDSNVTASYLIVMDLYGNLTHVQPLYDDTQPPEGVRSPRAPLAIPPKTHRIHHHQRSLSLSSPPFPPQPLPPDASRPRHEDEELDHHRRRARRFLRHVWPSHAIRPDHVDLDLDRGQRQFKRRRP